MVTSEINIRDRNIDVEVRGNPSFALLIEILNGPHTVHVGVCLMTKLSAPTSDILSAISTACVKVAYRFSDLKIIAGSVLKLSWSTYQCVPIRR